MYNLLLIPTFADAAARDAAAATIAEATAGLPGIRDILFAPTLPGVYNGGDYIWRAVFDNEAACQAALASPAWQPAAAILADRVLVPQLQRVGYEGGRSGGSSKGSGLYRVALFCANVRPTRERLDAFGAQTVTMPVHVRTMLRWQLSEAEGATGDRPWTHVWEQEYPDLDGLNGPYMLHPVHWAHVERWFDPEYTEHLVDPVLVHTFCAIDKGVILS
ncbi:stress responsive protein [Sphingomonas sp. DBB INV C78]|uniref:Dabb family protein n=1 Tax=Sphingomonas sp. DBB INV C78 TaxID=3349434 RepID=UPI0036D2F627